MSVAFNDAVARRSTLALGKMPGRSTSSLLGVRLMVFIIATSALEVPVYSFIHPLLSLNDHGRQAIAEVTGIEPQNHSGIHYEYVVSGKRYSKSYGPYDQTVKVGARIQATYLPESPSISVPGAPNMDGWWFLPFILAPGLGILAATYGVSSGWRKWESGDSRRGA